MKKIISTILLLAVLAAIIFIVGPFEKASYDDVATATPLVETPLGELILPNITYFEGADFPEFVEDVRALSRFADNGQGTAYFNEQLQANCIVLHQIGTDGLLAEGFQMDGLILTNIVQLNVEELAWYDGALYHFVVSDDENYEIGGKKYATTQWLVSTTAKAYHANDYNDHCIGISFVDRVEAGPMQPPQKNSVAELARYLVETQNIDPCRVWGHSEINSQREDPVGLNMTLFRIEIGCVAHKAKYPDYSIPFQ